MPSYLVWRSDAENARVYVTIVPDMQEDVCVNVLTTWFGISRPGNPIIVVCTCTWSDAAGDDRDPLCPAQLARECVAIVDGLDACYANFASNFRLLIHVDTGLLRAPEVARIKRPSKLRCVGQISS